MKKALSLLAISALLGCGPSVALTRVGPEVPSRPSSCDFTLLSAAPTESYQELGRIDLQYESQTEWITKESAFKRRIHPLVCQAGGDAAIAHTNEHGLYLKATVISLKPVKPISEKSAEPASESAGAEAE